MGWVVVLWKRRLPLNPLPVVVGPFVDDVQARAWILDNYKEALMRAPEEFWVTELIAPIKKEGSDAR